MEVAEKTQQKIPTPNPEIARQLVFLNVYKHLKSRKSKKMKMLHLRSVWVVVAALCAGASSVTPKARYYSIAPDPPPPKKKNFTLKMHLCVCKQHQTDKNIKLNSKLKHWLVQICGCRRTILFGQPRFLCHPFGTEKDTQEDPMQTENKTSSKKQLANL